MVKDEQSKAKEIKRHQFTMNLVSILFVAILTIVLTANLTMAAFNSNQGVNNGILIGTINLRNISQNFTIKDSLGATLTKVRPGDNAKVEFGILNTGTADMYVRYKLVLEDLNEVDPVDASAFVITLTSAKYVKTINGTPTEFNAEYVPYDFGGGDVWLVRRVKLIGNLDTLTNDPADTLKINIHFNGDLMDNTYKGANIRVSLSVQAVQAANNGTQTDPTLPGYNVSWI